MKSSLLLVMLFIVTLGKLQDGSVLLLFDFRIYDKCLDLGDKQLSSFSFEIIDMGEHLFQS